VNSSVEADPATEEAKAPEAEAVQPAEDPAELSLGRVRLAELWKTQSLDPAAAEEEAEAVSLEAEHRSEDPVKVSFGPVRSSELWKTQSLDPAAGRRRRRRYRSKRCSKRRTG
jgi:hypothetical protein